MKRKEIPLNDLVALKTSHDVRRLTLCAVCHHFGLKDLMIKQSEVDMHYHGRCYAKEFGISGFLNLPIEQLNNLTIGDIGPELMMQLIKSYGFEK